MEIAKYCFKDLKIGMMASFDVVITQDMLLDFAKLSGDYNPLQLDSEFAKNACGGGVYVYGMLLASFYSRLCGMHLPGENCLLHSVHSDFKKPVFINDRLRVSGEIIYLNEAFKALEIKAKMQRILADCSLELVGSAKIKAGCLK